ncbi:serine/threonine protein kinase [Actinomadura sp. ATCC 31491]|uniref:Serine/threonine protein kinase n=1 Tax=Actinomadura luzonensis TaxID=2805427 RepID=A0ABT0G0U0_9ACTN|nr:serine/threonine-protein kinase [Actinomadura luzonensis]MCK2218229.1 serine/threonine protein kinase [Actinomadura luzonensis]
MSSERLKPLEAGDPKQVGGYRLLARLGAGGMGRVYLGRSKGGRRVAVKVIHPHLAEDAQFRRRFRAEVAAVRRVGGIHTVQVVDAGADADPPWLVTEYIAGPSLHDAVGECGAFPAAAVAALGAGLAEGLMAIHERGVVHRDLKPGNVLLAQDGPRIIDFGIARALDAASQTTRTSVAGTPGFMSPEQLRGREVGPAGDVFCLAAVLAFAATGRRPFGEGPVEALGYRVVNEEPDLTGVPEPLLPLIASGLEKRPEDRPGLGAFLERCSALAEGGDAPLPAPVSTMIDTWVAETEVLAPPPPDEPGSGRRFPPLGRLGLPVAAAVGVLLVALAVWAVGDDGSTPATSEAVTTAQQTSVSPAPVPGKRSETPTPTPTPTPTSDPVRKAFEKISAGDCLDAYERPTGGWSRSKPRAVGCGRSDAHLKVLKVTRDSSGCLRHGADLDGELWWSYGEDADEIALCVQRQFHTGECFLATKGEKKNTVAISNRDLMTSWPCRDGSAPEEYDFVLRITAFTDGPCPPGGRRVDWEIRGRTLCTRIV